MARKKKKKKEHRKRKPKAKRSSDSKAGKRRKSKEREVVAPEPRVDEPEDDEDIEEEELEDDDSPITRAVDVALLEALGDRIPDRDYGTILGWDEGGPDPVDRISAYLVAGPPPHWLLVTCGLTERLFDLASGPGAPDGIELTARVERRGAAQEPPAWALSLLQGLVRHVCRTGEVPAEEQVRGPLSVHGAVGLQVVTFRAEPELQPQGTSWGRLGFLQVAQLAPDELGLAERWSVGHVVDALAERDPLLLLEPGRASLLADPARRAALEARAAASSSGARVALPRLDLRRPRGRLVLMIAAGSARALADGLDARVARGDPLEVVGPSIALAVESIADAARAGHGEERDGRVRLDLTRALARRVARDLTRAPAGERLQWPELPGVTLIVV